MKYVFIIQGYDKQDEFGRLDNVVTFELFAESAEKALERAKSILEKQFYRISSVIEKEDQKCLPQT